MSELNSYLCDLYRNGKRDFSNLNNDEARTLTGLIMKDDTNAIGDLLDLDKIESELANYLHSFDLNLNPENYNWEESHQNAREAFLESVLKIVTENARNRINNLFDDHDVEYRDYRDPDYNREDYLSAAS